MKNAVIKRINEGKKIEEIGAELCEGLKYPKRKIIDIIIETKGENYLNENKKQLGYRGGGGAGKPRKPKKTELQNFAAQAEPNLSESDKFKIKFTQLLNECQDSQPNDWKEILLKCIEDFEADLKANESNETSPASSEIKQVQNEEDDNGDDFDAPEACSIIHDKRFDVLNLDELNDEQIQKILEPVIIQNKDILKEIRLSFAFDKNLTKAIVLYKKKK